jgi:deoxyribodipyrimidine photo-lyase
MASRPGATGHVLFEPWTVETGTGGFYRVYTPFWKAVRGRDPGEPLSVPKLAAPEVWPENDELATWDLGAAMNRGAEIVRPHLVIGEEAARGRLGAFIANGIADYARTRETTSTATRPRACRKT